MPDTPQQHDPSAGTPPPGGTQSHVRNFLAGVGLGADAGPEAEATRPDNRPAEPTGGDGGAAVPGYEILSELGRGGMGVVYKARQAGLNRVVALKMVIAGPYTSPTARARFLIEAEAVAALEHPHVVRVFAFGEHAGRPYLAMEFLPGGTLAQRVQKGGPLPPPDAAGLVAKLAEATAHAHSRGVVHRDIKPANVMLAADGEPRLTDFGLAKVGPSDVTATGAILGTPAYMSPEQAAGRTHEVGTHSDVYALGAVLYDLLTGRPPFRAESALGTIREVLWSEPTRPRRLNAAVPRDLETVCLKCLEKDPGKRYPSAQALADDLRRFLAGEPVAARPVGAAGRVWRRARRNPVMSGLIGLTATALLAALGLGVWYRVQRERDADAVAAATQAAELRRVRDEAAVAAARQAADAERFHATLNRVRERRANPYPGWVDESLADLRTLAALPAATAAAADLRSEAAAALSAVDLRPVRALAPGFVAFAVAFSPDGKVLAAVPKEALPVGEVWLIDPATGAIVRKLLFPADARWLLVEGRPDGGRSVAFSPGGRWLVAGTRSGRLVRWDLSSPDPQPVAWQAHPFERKNARRASVVSVGFTADGAVLLSGASDGTYGARGWQVGGDWKMLWERPEAVLPRSTYSIRGKAVARLDRKDQPHEVGDLDPRTGEFSPRGTYTRGVLCLNRNGDLIGASRGRDPCLSLVPREADAQPRALTDNLPDRGEQADYADLAFSPGGDLLATSEEFDRRVRLWDTSAGILAAERILPAPSGTGRLAFSPDGRFLAVAESNRVGLYEIAGGVRATRALGPERWVAAGGVSADGRTIVTAAADQPLPFRVRAWRDGDPAPEVLSAGFPDDSPLWRPHSVLDVTADGRECAFGVEISRGAAQSWVFTRSHQGVRLADGVSNLRFGPDGRVWVTDGLTVKAFGLPGWKESRLLANDWPSRNAGIGFRALTVGRCGALVGRRDGRVYLLDPVEGERAAWPVLGSPVEGLALSPGEDTALVGGERGEVRLLRLADGTATTIPDAHRDAVRGVAFGPGFLATGSADRTVKLWTPSGAPLLTLRTAGPVQKLAVSGDGRLLTVFVGGERGVRQWHLGALHRELAALGIAPGFPAP